MRSIVKYISEVLSGVWSLLKGMKVTGSYFFRPSAIVTQKYPENRKDLVMFERFKGEVIMPHNENNEHRCTGCGICEINCPNGTIEVITKTIITPEGKKKRAIDKHIYRLSMCSFCALCVKTCPSNALAFSQEFEHAVFDRSKLIKISNKPGSQLMKGVE
ncbi:MAG TPA: 4Fe-4S binding protein [Bacteroidales bacterium]|jgi:NADH-quinone oxidoreductase subunit I|nr:4Fe-4S dicluster domain-containing protein [Bacteroidales bacterium]HNR42099.1 4Fe-4S binding protein [Bacteroidales bacterium]HPM19403.1 4Fe-4S binding protein [Bacteroidales bacterium]HQG77487.1 4Fe-4S binding protein [Bacteroidales bacterium]